MCCPCWHELGNSEAELRDGRVSHSKLDRRLARCVQQDLQKSTEPVTAYRRIGELTRTLPRIITQYLDSKHQPYPPKPPYYTKLHPEPLNCKTLHSKPLMLPNTTPAVREVPQILVVPALDQAQWHGPSRRHRVIWDFPRIRGTLFWGPYNKDPTIQGTILGSPFFGNPHIVAVM